MRICHVKQQKYTRQAKMLPTVPGIAGEYTRSLNKGDGANRFRFQTFAQRVASLGADVTKAKERARFELAEAPKRVRRNS
jgi:hypothetical protein